MNKILSFLNLKRREPRAWLCMDGKKMPLEVEKPTKLSALGMWSREHPNRSANFTRAERRLINK